MRDPRIDALAKVLVEHSMDVKTGDNILLNLRDYDRDMACALIEAVYHRGGKTKIWCFTRQKAFSA